METSGKVVIIGAGVFGLSLAQQLAQEGHKNITILDRHMPPVPDGSSNDISRVIRFDYADEDYFKIAHEAYGKWKSSRYDGIFYPTPYVLTHSKGQLGEEWVKKTTSVLTNHQLSHTTLPDAKATREMYPTLTGDLTPRFAGYTHRQAGWADAAKAITQLRNECIDLGVSFVSGHAGTVTGLETDSIGKIKSVRTLNGHTVQGDYFVLASGAWTSSLVPMYNSTISTAQVVGYVQLSEAEMDKYKDLPIYMNATSGWFNFPPHPETRMLKMAVHGWGYTRQPDERQKATIKTELSTPPSLPIHQRPNFAPADGEARLKQGLVEIMPEFKTRKFDRMILCWYTDTPTGDFIMDYHPDFKNLFIAGGGSGHAFKFLPVLGKYTALSFKKQLPAHLEKKWRFRMEYKNESQVFEGDGSRGGPKRRELDVQERAKL